MSGDFFVEKMRMLYYNKRKIKFCCVCNMKKSIKLKTAEGVMFNEI